MLAYAGDEGPFPWCHFSRATWMTIFCCSTRVCIIYDAMWSLACMVHECGRVPPRTRGLFAEEGRAGSGCSGEEGIGRGLSNSTPSINLQHTRIESGFELAMKLQLPFISRRSSRRQGVSELQHCYESCISSGHQGSASLSACRPNLRQPYLASNLDWR